MWWSSGYKPLEWKPVIWTEDGHFLALVETIFFLKEQVEGNVYIASMHVCMQVEGYFFENKEMPAGICND